MAIDIRVGSDTECRGRLNKTGTGCKELRYEASRAPVTQTWVQVVSWSHPTRVDDKRSRTESHESEICEVETDRV